MIDNVTLSVDVDVLEDSAAKITSGWSLCAAVIHCVLLPPNPLPLLQQDSSKKVYPLSTVFAGTSCFQLICAV